MPSAPVNSSPQPQLHAPPPAARVDELESLRGLAALLVVVYHVPKWHPMLDIGLVNNGYLMVELFFVLSGFVIFNAYAGQLNSGRDLLRFQFLRWGRLYPVHLLFLALFVAIELAKALALASLGTPDIRSAPFQKNSPEALLQHLFLVQAIGPMGQAITFNNPAWSISVEFYTYLVFGLAMLWLHKALRLPFFVVLAAASVLMLASQQTHGFTDLLRCLAGFSIGCLTAALLPRVRLRLPGWVPAGVGLLMLAFLQLKTDKALDVLVYALSAALLATLLLAQGGLLRRVLRHRLLLWLGRISYSVYMSHALVLWAMANVLKRLLKRPEVQTPGGEWLLVLGPAEMALSLLAMVLAVLALSQLTYWAVEKPLRQWSRRVARARLA